MTKVILAIALTALLAGTADQLVAHTNQDGPIPHTNQDWVLQSLDTEEEAALREIALIYISLNNLESLGLVTPGTSEMLALAADLGTECANLAISVCGKGKVCYICVCWDGDNGGDCSFGCDTGGGCVPAPPCGCNTAVW